MASKTSKTEDVDDYLSKFTPMKLSKRYAGGDARRAEMEKKYPGISEDSLPPSDAEARMMTALAQSVTDDAQKQQITERLLLTFVRGFVTGRYKNLSREKGLKETIPIFRNCVKFRVKFDCMNALSPKDWKHSLKEEDVRVKDREWVERVMPTGDVDGRMVLVTSPLSGKIMEHFPFPQRKEEFIKHQIVALEAQNRWKDEHEAKTDKLLYKHILVVDMSLASVSLAKVNYLKSMLQWALGTYPEDPKRADSCVSDYYPETLKSLWAVNVPLVFRAVWNVAKVFVDPITVKKFKLEGGVPLKRMQEDGIPLQSLPKYLGGKGPDPIGYHYKCNVPAAKMLTKTFDVKSGSKIMWDLSTKQKYIYVMVLFEGKALQSWNGGKDMMKVTRVKIEQNTFVNGYLQVPKDGTLEIVFDNREFNWYSSEVLYEVRVTKGSPVATQCGTATVTSVSSKDSS